MRTPTRITVAVAGCSAAALALVGCGTVHVGQTGQAGSTRSATTAQATNSNPPPAQRASADAASLLAAFPPPPGAVKTGRLSQLPNPPESAADPDLVTRTSWWRAPGQPAAVLSWIRTHMPAGIAYGGRGYLTRGSKPPLVPPGLQPWKPPPPNSKLVLMQWDQYSKPSVPGVLSVRWLLVSATAYGTGQVAIRVDSEVSWLPAKPTGERIPATAKVVTIAPLTFGPPAADDHPVTITDPAKVAEIAAVIDSLPVFPPGVMSCPMDFGGGLRLTFRAAAAGGPGQSNTVAGPVLAMVTADTSGCGAVQVSVGGKPMRTLSQGGTLVARVRNITGLNWPTVPPAPHSQSSPASLRDATTSAALPR